MLMQDGYPPALLRRRWRGSYLGALDSAVMRANYSPLAKPLGRAVEGSLDLYLDAVAASGEEQEPLAQLAEGSGYSVDYLGWLARHGQLEATKRRGRWYASRGAIARYKEQFAANTLKLSQPSILACSPIMCYNTAISHRYIVYSANLCHQQARFRR